MCASFASSCSRSRSASSRACQGGARVGGARARRRQRAGAHLLLLEFRGALLVLALEELRLPPGKLALARVEERALLAQLSSPMPVTMMVGDKKDASAADSSATDTEAVELEVKD